MNLPSQLLLAAAALIALWWSAERARELCVLSVRDGRILRLRGKLPAEARAALDDVLSRAGVARGTVRVLRGDKRASLALTGIDERTAQRLRNVIGTFSMARLQSGPAAQRQNFGQRVGIAWLAWWLEARKRRTP